MVIKMKKYLTEFWESLGGLSGASRLSLTAGLLAMAVYAVDDCRYKKNQALVNLRTAECVYQLGNEVERQRRAIEGLERRLDIPSER